MSKRKKVPLDKKQPHAIIWKHNFHSKVKDWAIMHQGSEGHLISGENIGMP